MTVFDDQKPMNADDVRRIVREELTALLVQAGFGPTEEDE